LRISLISYAFHNLQSEIRTPKFRNEWLADPGCFPFGKQHRLDKLARAVSTIAKRTLRVVAGHVFKFAPFTLNRLRFDLPSRHFDPIGTEFL
jgi:hypothetical protein